MRLLRQGNVTAPAIGFLWGASMAVCAAVVLALATGSAARPDLLAAGLAGAACGFAFIHAGRLPGRADWAAAVIGLTVLFAASQGLPFSLSLGSAQPLHGIAILFLVAVTVIPLGRILSGLPADTLDRHEFERCVIRFLSGWGSVFLAAIVAIPFFIMVMTSFKSQQDLLANPLDRAYPVNADTHYM